MDGGSTATETAYTANHCVHSLYCLHCSHFPHCLHCLQCLNYLHCFHWCKGSFRQYCAVLGWTKLHWAILGCTGLYWAILGCTGMYCIGSTGLTGLILLKWVITGHTRWWLLWWWCEYCYGGSTHKSQKSEGSRSHLCMGYAVAVMLLYMVTNKSQIWTRAGCWCHYWQLLLQCVLLYHAFGVLGKLSFTF